MRDAVPAFATDWEQHPPRQLWRRPVGPGWSSMAVVGGRLFTQEQRGGEEAVVCLDAATGSEVWSHTERARFEDVLSSAGPRATPTFDTGRLYVQGATGTLLCLDASTGSKLWSRDVLADSGGKLPEWGVAASPLVTDGTVVTFCSGEGNKGLLAYRAGDASIAWSADEGMRSYSSPHLATIGGKRQVLFVGDQGVASHDVVTGELLWRYATPGREPRSCQPLPLGNSQGDGDGGGARLLVSLGMDAPTDLLDLKPDAAAGKTTATKRWTSRDLKPSFNDFVVLDNCAYGFDGRIFTCVDLETGKRKWKQGRYGTGQVILLADRKLLIVLADDGQAALVSANPNAFEELGRFQAIEGKTWNHPVVSQGRLYVRNAQEMACYELTDGR